MAEVVYITPGLGASCVRRATLFTYDVAVEAPQIHRKLCIDRPCQDPRVLVVWPSSPSGNCWYGYPSVKSTKQPVPPWHGGHNDLRTVFETVTGEPFKQSAEFNGEPIKMKG